MPARLVYMPRCPFAQSACIALGRAQPTTEERRRSSRRRRRSQGDAPGGEFDLSPWRSLSEVAPAIIAALLTPEMLEFTGADRFPPVPLHLVVRS